MEASGANWQMLTFGGLVHSFCEPENPVPGIAEYNAAAAQELAYALHRNANALHQLEFYYPQMQQVLHQEHGGLTGMDMSMIPVAQQMQQAQQRQQFQSAPQAKAGQRLNFEAGGYQ